MREMMQAAPRATTGRAIPNFPLLTEAIGGLRGVTMIGGPTGHAKSRLTANIIGSVGGPDLPVFYLDRENDDQVDDDGNELTREAGFWIAEAYGPDCPAIDAIYGYHDYAMLKNDVAESAAPGLIVIDTVQSVVGESGDRTRTDMNALVEWSKAQVRRGFLVLLVSQVNWAGEFKESKALKEGGWTNLTVQKNGDRIEVRVGKVRKKALDREGVVLQIDGARLTEVQALSRVGRELGRPSKLTPLQNAILKAGGRIEFEALLRARGYSTKRGSASRRKGEREFATAVEALQIGHPEKGIYTYPLGDKTDDSTSSRSVVASSDANPREGEPNTA